MLRTNRHALTAETALLVVDVGKIAFDGDGTEVTLLLTLATADTTDGTSLHRHRALVLVDARDEHSPTLRPLLTQFDDVARTSLHTGTTGHALLFIDLGNTGLRIDVDGVKLTSRHTIATAEASEAAGRFSGTTGMHGRTRTKTCIFSNLRTMLTCAVTSYYCDLRLAIGYCHTEQVGHLAHHAGTAHRTVQAFDGTGVSTLDECIRHTSATCKSAAATVGTWQHFIHLRNAGVFINSKFLGGGKQHDGCYQANGSKHNHCNQDEIHKYLFICFSFKLSVYLKRYLPLNPVTQQPEHKVVWQQRA